MTLNGRNFYNIFCFSLPLDWPPTSAATSVYRLSWVVATDTTSSTTTWRSCTTTPASRTRTPPSSSPTPRYRACPSVRLSARLSVHLSVLFVCLFNTEVKRIILIYTIWNNLKMSLMYVLGVKSWSNDLTYSKTGRFNFLKMKFL